MNCPNCGQEVSAHSEFCPTCGTPLGAAKTQRMRTPVSAPTNGGPAYGGPVNEGPVNGNPYPTQYTPEPKKSPVGKIVAAVLIVALLGGGGFGAWKLLSHQHELEDQLAQAQQQADQQAQQTDQGTQDSEDADEATEASSQQGETEETPQNVLVGTWTGELVEADRFFPDSYQCYGAQTYNPVLTIDSVDNLGKIHCSLTVLVHNHKQAELTSDVNSHEDDQIIEFDDLITTLDDDEFELTLYIPGTQDTIDVEVEILEQSTVATQLSMVVDSGYFIDTYHLSRS